MGKYVVPWEIDRSRVPVSPKERGPAWSLLLEVVKKDIKPGIVKDWGALVGEINGYSIAVGTEVEIGNMLMQYAPYISFKTHPVASVAQVGDIIKKTSGRPSRFRLVCRLGSASRDGHSVTYTRVYWPRPTIHVSGCPAFAATKPRKEV